MSEGSAKLIKDFMQRNCITVSEFAFVTDLSRWTIYKYLKGGDVQPKAARKIETNILKEYRILFPHEKLLE